MSPSLDQGVHLKNKIDTITINHNQNILINNNDTNEEQFKQEIIMKLSIVSENNLILIVDELLDMLTKKKVIDNISNNNINYQKIRLPFMNILDNEAYFSDIIIDKAVCEINKVEIFANVCKELCGRLRNEFNLRENDKEQDLTMLLSEDCKLKFEEIILDNNYNSSDNQLLGIILFVCELINCRIIPLDNGYSYFEKLYQKFIHEKNENMNKYYYLDLIVEFLKKYGKIIYIEKNMKYLERIENYVENELTDLINNDNNLPKFLVNKIMNLIRSKNNNWNN